MEPNVETVVKSPFFVGLLGSLAGLRSVPGTSWVSRLFNVVAGALMAGFLGPAIAEWFELNSSAMQSATAFAVGLFGLSITVLITEQISTLKIADFIPWLRRSTKDERS